jgi:hypothetical protein
MLNPWCGWLQDYMENQMVSQSFTQSFSAVPGRAGMPENQRFSSYSGSSFSTTFDPDNVPVDRSPVYSGWAFFIICIFKIFVLVEVITIF